MDVKKEKKRKREKETRSKKGVQAKIRIVLSSNQIVEQ
jgi:hypothetical protein